MNAAPALWALIFTAFTVTSTPCSAQDGESRNAGMTTLRFAVDGTVTGLTWPIQARLPSGLVATFEDRSAVARIPTDPSSLQRIEVLGWGSIWLLAEAGHETIVEEHPCCGLSVADPRRLDVAVASCPEAPGGSPCPEGTEIGDSQCSCPESTEALRPAPAEDPRSA